MNLGSDFVPFFKKVTCNFTNLSVNVVFRVLLQIQTQWLQLNLLKIQLFSGHCIAVLLKHSNQTYKINGDIRGALHKTAGISGQLKIEKNYRFRQFFFGLVSTYLSKYWWPYRWPFLTASLSPLTRNHIPRPENEKALVYRSGFLKRDQYHSPNSHQKIWRTNGLMTGALLEVISLIHRIRRSQEDPMDVRNDSKQGTCSQAVWSSKFLMWIWRVISILFETRVKASF